MLYKPYTQLSKKVRCVQKNRQFTVISLPQGMEVTEIGGFSVTQKTPTVAILDEFYKENQKLASGVKSSHGDIVTKYVVNGLEDQIGVLACNAISDIFTNHSGSTFPAKQAGYGVMHALEFLVKVQKKYHNIIAVNMSVAYEMLPDYIGPMTSITPKNRGRFLERLEYLAEKERIYKSDESITCKKCGKEFIWTAGEKVFYRERGFHRPSLCKECKANQKMRITFHK